MVGVILKGLPWLAGALGAVFLFLIGKSFLKGYQEGVRLNLIEPFLLSETQVRYLLGIGEVIYMESIQNSLFFEVQVVLDKLCFRSAYTGDDYEFPCEDAEFPMRVIKNLVDCHAMLCYRKQAMTELGKSGFVLHDVKR